MKNLLFILLALAVVTASAQPKQKADSLKAHAITVGGSEAVARALKPTYVSSLVDAHITVDEITNKKLDDLAQAQQIINQRWRDVIETLYGQNKIVADSVAEFRRDNGTIFLKVKVKPKPK